MILRVNWCLTIAAVLAATRPTALHALHLLEEPIKLSSGYFMPRVGFGTANLSGEKLAIAIEAALDNGYRHIDAADMYGNEHELGQALNKWLANGGKREDLFVTSKLPPQGNRPEEAMSYLNRSLERLGLDYLDLYLIHFPAGTFSDENMQMAWNEDGTVALDMDVDLVAVWRVLESQVRAGRIRSIGVSNFNACQLERLWKFAEIKPANLQIERNVYLQQWDLINLCHRLNVTVTGYSPLGSGGSSSGRLPSLVQHPSVKRIALKYRKTPAQVVLRFGLQNGLAVIPSSSNPDRIKENAQLDFVLIFRDMLELLKLDQFGRYRKFDFSFWKGVQKSPEYPF